MHLQAKKIKSNFICIARNHNLQSSHWALTDCTVVTSSALRPLNWMRKNSNPKQGK